MTMVMSRTIAAGEFKAKCLALLDEVKDQGGEIIVTKRGEPIARLVPLAKKPAKRKMPAIGWMKGRGEIVGDIISPLYGGDFELGANDPDWWYDQSKDTRKN